MELETTAKVSVERLRPHRRNPRRIDTDDRALDEASVARLCLFAEQDELLLSISAHGYLDREWMASV